MKHLFALIGLVALGWLPVALPSQTAEAAVDDMLGFTGMAEQLASLASTIGTLYQQQEKNLKPGSYQAIQNIVREQFSQAVFIRYVKDELTKSYDPKLYGKLKADYQDPLVIAITKAEIQYSATRNQTKIDAYDYSEVPATRKQALEALLLSTDELTIMELMAKDAMQAFLTTFNLFLPPEKKIKPELSRGLIDKVVADVRSPASLLRLKKSYALCYADFSNQQVLEYAKLYATEEGTWFMQGYLRGFAAGYKAAMQKAADEIIQSLDSQSSNA